MVNGLKLKSADDFEVLLKSLVDNLFHAKVYFIILNEMHRQAKTHEAEMNQSLVFGGPQEWLMRVNVPQNVRAFQTVGEHQLFIVQQFDRCAVGHDFPAIQHNRA